jgi:lysozyme
MADNTKAKAAAAGVVGIGLLVSMLMNFEGTETIAYLDPIGIPTVCTGHTGPEVKAGQRKSLDECRAILTGDALKAWDAVDRDVIPEMQPYQQVAFSSFVFNVGEASFKGSTMLRLANAQRWIESCNQLSLWVYAGKPPHRSILPGLVTRRAAEMKLCLGQGS